MVRKRKLKGLRNLHAFVYGGNRILASAVYESRPNAHLEGRSNRTGLTGLSGSLRKKREGVEIGEIVVNVTIKKAAEGEEKSE